MWRRLDVHAVKSHIIEMKCATLINNEYLIIALIYDTISCQYICFLKLSHDNTTLSTLLYKDGSLWGF